MVAAAAMQIASLVAMRMCRLLMKARIERVPWLVEGPSSRLDRAQHKERNPAVPEGDKGQTRSLGGREHVPDGAYPGVEEKVQGGGMTQELLRMRWPAMAVLGGLTAGCQGSAPTDLPEQYLSNPAVQACAARVQSVEGVRGELLYDAEHGLRTFRPVGSGTLARAARLEIGRGEPLQALAERLRRTDRLSIGADVTFDGWALRKSACPSLDGDTYFVRRFTNIVPQDTESPR